MQPDDRQPKPSGGRRAWQYVTAPVVLLRALGFYIARWIDAEDFNAELNRARAMTGREPI